MQECSAWDCAKATCQDRARIVSKSTQRFGPMKCIPAVLPSCLGTHTAFCLVWQPGDSFTGTMLWKPTDFHAYPGQGEGTKRTKSWIYWMCTSPTAAETGARAYAQPHSKWWRPEDTAPVTPSPFFSEAFWVSPLPEAAVYPCRSGTHAKEAMT